jgi:hypothetical protein
MQNYVERLLKLFLPKNPPLPKAGFEYTLWYGRNRNNVDGVLTLNGKNAQGEVHNVLIRLPARSGQNGALAVDTIANRSAIPYNGKDVKPFASYWLWTKPYDPTVFLPQTPAGIGRFYPISSGNNKRNIVVMDGTHAVIRVDCGLHPENAYPGSAGCVVLLHRNRAEAVGLACLLNFIDVLATKGVERLPLNVVHYNPKQKG